MSKFSWSLFVCLVCLGGAQWHISTKRLLVPRIGEDKISQERVNTVKKNVTYMIKTKEVKETCWSNSVIKYFFDKINDAAWGDFAEQVQQVCDGKMISRD